MQPDSRRNVRSARELAKIVLRDTRVSDARSNLQRLVRLARRGFPYILVVPYEASAETLADQGIKADVVPIGSGSRHCVDLRLERELDVLFLGALDVPRRRHLLVQLRQAGVNVRAGGDWFDPAFWGDARARLLNQTRILLNLGRSPGQLSGHRLSGR